MSCLEDPLAWGFYGHRLKLYREVVPHTEFAILQRWAQRMRLGAFVRTSNVDGQFQRAGFPEQVVSECHGSIHYLQCAVPCRTNIWAATEFEPQVDEHACRLVGALPRCPDCGGIARPNVLMFYDSGWLSRRTDAHEARLQRWIDSTRRMVTAELEAGTALPTIRRFSERHGPRVIRIDLREPQIDPPKGIGIQGGAFYAPVALDHALDQAGGGMHPC